MDNKGDISKILKRLERLEKQVFGAEASTTRLCVPRAAKKQDFKASSYSGPAGGVRLLIEESFFSRKQGLAEVRSALATKEYVYRDSAIQTALNRMTGKEGPLVSMKEGGRKVYALRK